jgi:two-component system response regulator CpxR
MAYEPTIVAGGITPGVSILLIDDDVELVSLLREFFAPHGINLESAVDGRRGLAQALHGRHELILLDVMLSGINGIELLRQIRRRSQVPVIMLTARTAKVDRVAGLNAGADDYLPKPFDPDELLARIGAVLRRAHATHPLRAEVLESGPVRLVAGAREVWCDERSVGLTNVEYDILELLVRSAGRAVSRDELMAILHQRRLTPFDRSLDIHICHIRKKLGSRGELIRTIRGVGYLYGVESVGGAGR